MKKITPLIFIIVGSALLITSVAFWIDTRTSSEPTSFGQSLRDWLTLFVGLGASIKGWKDLFAKEKTSSTDAKININDSSLHVENKGDIRKINTVNYIENQVVQPTVRMDIDYRELHLSQEQEKEFLKIYLEGVEKFTRMLPWGHTLSVISPDLEISQIYVSPSFTLQEKQKDTSIIADEKQERDQERREKELRKATAAKHLKYFGIQDLLETTHPIAIVGYMGTGKSLAANFIAWNLVKDSSSKTSNLPRQKTPILIRLGDPAILELPNLSNSIFELAVAHFPEDIRKNLSFILYKEWQRGKIVLILDALDEFNGASEWIKNELDYLTEAAKLGNQIILTSRPSAYRLVRPAGFKNYSLEEIEKNNLGRYIEKWVSAVLPVSDRNDVNPDAHSNYLREQISTYPLVESLVANPLLLTILVALSLSTKGIDFSNVKNETDLYQQYIDYIIFREKQKTKNLTTEEISTSLLKIAFGYMGLLIQVGKTKLDLQAPSLDFLVDEISTSEYFKDEGNGRLLTEKSIEFWKNANLVVVENEGSSFVNFRHQAFQFYGAALGIKYMASKDQKDLLAKIIKNPLWSDVIRIYLGIKSNSSLS